MIWMSYSGSTIRQLQRIPVVIAVGGIIVLYLGHHVWRRFRHQRRLTELIRVKRMERLQNRRSLGQRLRDLGVSAAEVDVIAGYDFEVGTHVGVTSTDMKYYNIDILQTLSAGLRNGSLSPVSVLRAFQFMALEVNENLNCVTNFFEEAESWARKLEAINNPEDYPLFGIPVSIKECYRVKGLDSTIGLSKFINCPSAKDSRAVHLLKSLGAIPFCHTNVSHAMLSLECSNPIFGKTGNPYNFSRDSGASSGGEAALIKGGGSVLGIGTDFAGSLRNPSVLCGIYALKPTHGRHLSQIGVRILIDDRAAIGIHLVGGFMTNSVSALVQAWTAVWNSNIENDPNLVPLPWNDQKFKDKRAVMEATNILKQNGHEIIEFYPPPMKETLNIFFGLLLADNGGVAIQCLTDDLPDTSTRTVLLNARLNLLPRCFSKFLTKLTTKLDFPSWEIEEALAEKNRLFIEYMSEFKAAGLDAVIAPGSFVPAPYKGQHGDIPAAVFPYIPWSLFNLPIGVAPVSVVTEKDELALKEMPNDDLIYKMMKQASREGLGLPLGVQIIAQRFDEEIIIRVMKEIGLN